MSSCLRRFASSISFAVLSSTARVMLATIHTAWQSFRYWRRKDSRAQAKQTCPYRTDFGPDCVGVKVSPLGLGKQMSYTGGTGRLERKRRKNPWPQGKDTQAPSPAGTRSETQSYLFGCSVPGGVGIPDSRQIHQHSPRFQHFRFSDTDPHTLHDRPELPAFHLAQIIGLRINVFLNFCTEDGCLGRKKKTQLNIHPRPPMVQMKNAG